MHKIDLRKIFECSHLKLTVYGRKQTSIYVTNTLPHAVPLVRGPLRLVPISFHGIAIFNMSSLQMISPITWLVIGEINYLAGLSFHDEPAAQSHIPNPDQ